MIHVDVTVSHPAIVGGMLRGKTAVVIDTLRATSVMVTAMSNGADEIRCVLEPEEALALKEKDPKLILGGERSSLKIPGFDLSNSPLEFTREIVSGKCLVMTTSNGTRALLKSEEAEKVYIGCLLNASSASEKALAEGRDIQLINAGTAGLFTLDDFIAAGAMIHQLKGRVTLSDTARAALLLFEAYPDIHSALRGSRHYERLHSIGRQEDLDYCLSTDLVSIVPVYQAGRVTLDRQ